jgi:hypothetical protein
MDGNHSSFVEAARLVRKFFPEAKSWTSPDIGLDWEVFLGAMMSAKYTADYSCYPCRNPTDPDLGLADKGGLEGSDRDVYLRLMSHAEMSPSGRAVVIPDAIGTKSWSADDCLPFVCDSQKVPERLQEVNCFNHARDTVFVFESGEAILVDHDERVHWARSKINRRRLKSCEQSNALEPAAGSAASGQSSPPAQ